MEVLDQVFGSGNIGNRFPRLLFDWIAFPMDEVVQLPMDKLGIQDLLNFIDVVGSINGRWWRLFLRWVQRSSKWSGKHFIEHRMNRMPSLWQVKLVHGFADLLNNLERAVSLVIKCLGWPVSTYV